MGATSLVIYLDATGRENLNFSVNIRDIDEWTLHYGVKVETFTLDVSSLAANDVSSAERFPLPR